MKTFIFGKTSYRCILFSIFFITVLSCRENEHALVVSEPLTISKAKTWFDNRYGRARIGDSLQREVHWNYAMTFSLGSISLVVAPAIQNKQQIPSAYKQIWIYKDKTGTETLRVVEFIYDEFKIRKPRSLDQFSGIILVRSWDNNIIGGFRVNNNQINGVVTHVNNTVDASDNWNILDYNCGSGLKDLVQRYPYDGHFPGSQEEDIAYQVSISQADYECTWQSIFDVSTLPNKGKLALPQPGLNTSNPNGRAVLGGSYLYSVGVFNSICQGAKAQYQASIDQGTEIGGLLNTTDSSFVILPSYGNTTTKTNWRVKYYNVGGQVLVDIRTSGVDKLDYYTFIYHYNPRTGTFDGDVLKQGLADGIIHTHPCGSGYGTYSPSPDDISIAVDSFWGIVRQFINTCTNYFEYNDSGNTINTYQKNC